MLYLHPNCINRISAASRYKIGKVEDEIISRISSAVEQLIRNQQVEGSNPLFGSKRRDVAQLGSVRRSGRRGRWFESSHPD